MRIVNDIARSKRANPLAKPEYLALDRGWLGEALDLTLANDQLSAEELSRLESE
jgi:hypothetical protein